MEGKLRQFMLPGRGPGMKCGGRDSLRDPGKGSWKGGCWGYSQWATRCLKWSEQQQQQQNTAMFYELSEGWEGSMKGKLWEWVLAELERKKRRYKKRQSQGVPGGSVG